MFAHADSIATKNNDSQTTQNETLTATKVKSLYIESPILKSTNISVRMHHQHAILSGTLETDAQYEDAVRLAQSVEGVSEVNTTDLLVIKSKSPLNDTYITAKVKGSLMKEKLFGDKAVEYWPVCVTTKNGVVYLTGMVDTEEQKTNILALLGKLEGIKSIESSLTVK